MVLPTVSALGRQTYLARSSSTGCSVLVFSPVQRIIPPALLISLLPLLSESHAVNRGKRSKILSFCFETGIAMPTSITAEQALSRLIEGNQRFMRGEARFPTVCKETLAQLAKEQKPFATILGCSDSRVPPELIFDANFGELFIIRVAGNVISPEVKGSLQYAGAHLRTPLFVVLGHEHCGAVSAALAYRQHRTMHHSHIQTLIDNINAGLEVDDHHLCYEEQFANAVKANVRWSMKQILETPEWVNAREAGAKLVGAVFGISAGEVRFLP